MLEHDAKLQRKLKESGIPVPSSEKLVDKKAGSGMTPLMCAIEKDYSDVIKMLHDSRANPPKSDKGEVIRLVVF